MNLTPEDRADIIGSLFFLSTLAVCLFLACFL